MVSAKTHWLLPTTPHADEVHRDFGDPNRSYWVDSLPAPGHGDAVYLWRMNEDDVYGWGDASGEPKEELDSNSNKRRIKISAKLKEVFDAGRTIELRPVRGSIGLDDLKDLDSARAIALSPGQAVAMNRMIRALGFDGPEDPSLSTARKVTYFDPRKVDAAYKPFPSFDEWTRCSVNTARWDRYSSVLR